MRNTLYLHIHTYASGNLKISNILAHFLPVILLCMAGLGSLDGWMYGICVCCSWRICSS
jgi:hypothetical protein